MLGGVGSDVYVIDSVFDVIDEEGNTDADDAVESALSVDLAVMFSGAIEHAALTGKSNLNAIGNAADNRLTGNGGSNVLDGGIGNDTLKGGSGIDTLIGGLGNDTLDGGTGNNTIDGGAGGGGNDVLTGGSASDTFVFALNSSGSDAIADFDGSTDKLSFFDVLDSNGDSILDLTDVEALVNTLADDGTDILVSFTTGSNIAFQGAGTGSIAQLSDLVTDPSGQILIA